MLKMKFLLLPKNEKDGLRKLLEKMNIWINPRKTSLHRSWQTIGNVIPASLLLTMVVSMYLAGWKKSLQEAALYFVIGLIANSQQIFFVMNQKHVGSLLDSLEAFEKRRSRDDKAFFNSECRKSWKIVDLYWKSIVVYVTVISISPVLIDLTFGNIFPRMPPFRVNIPMQGFLDMCEPRGLADLVVNLICLVWLIFTVLGHFGMEAILILVSCYVRTEMKLVYRELENLKTLYMEQHNDRGIFFRQVICHHQNIVTVLKKMNNALGLPIVIQNSTLSACFCVCLYQVTCADSKDGLITALQAVYGLVILLLLTYFLCAEGESLETVNNEILHKLYDLPWHEECPAFRKDLNMVIRQVKRPFTITYQGLPVLRVTSFMKIINTSYSYFMMLTSTMR
nr:olfactory receptor 79 [Tropidothorax elegans]